ncbi:MAG TPA: Asp-tRNA(Asn)/Glu-tRNA(Gln) amidotransferase subunit GatC [Tissierellaceae bacterium]|nr:Asp-tRNA(Asn)/Glu-tRNA(Gln) amidotransferase subunit GatC [Tissierellaceae bacterium]
MINKEEILRMAELAKLKVSEEETEPLVEELSFMIKSMDKIKNLKDEDFKLDDGENKLTNPLREDIVKESLPVEEVLKNTVDQQYGYFKILNVMD